jgi:hypothetical protein
MALDINMFYSCTVEERLEIISESGEYINSIKHFGYYIHLYVAQGDFIEIYYNIDTNEIEDVEILDPDNERLNWFAIAVDLSDLYR